MSDVICFRCKQAGHVKAQCPHRQEPKPPAAASARATAAPRKQDYRRTDVIECPVCERDWVAVFTSQTQHLFTTYCPWCRIFTKDQDGAIRRRELISQLYGFADSNQTLRSRRYRRYAPLDG